jgi:hypothetical protein
MACVSVVSKRAVGRYNIYLLLGFRAGYCDTLFKAIIPNGQPKPLANRYNQYLSR